MDNELILFDRLNVIRDVIKKHGEENFYLSFSGGKDSTTLHYLLDEALPGNKIPRVFADTGIEYNDIKEFVLSMQAADERIQIIKPMQNVKHVLEIYGYPFKSKLHAHVVAVYQRSGKGNYVKRYLNSDDIHQCPKILRYQFTSEFNLKIDNKCCQKLKKEPFKRWEKANKKTIAITGMMASEGGQRESIKGCIITDKDGKASKFHPLLKVSEEWEQWYIVKRGIKLCKLYYPPYSFKRTGCKGCPFALHLQEQLETMSRLMPSERKQCELIWQPVYAEYRRIGYRLKTDEQLRLF
ncbi:phosphoadenosine phosphosulfate reductase domain-containing protein [Dielma fastidiosa]|uniref:phosphoadenosine phosphosulfate reductase domain-containing protein n=1 Tax=Dielma fastidiosa TaxID=1034346 RepID=UPI00356265AD